MLIRFVFLDLFRQLLVCPVQGHVQPLASADSMCASTLCRLTSLLLRFAVDQQGAQPSDQQPSANGNGEGQASAAPAGPSTPSLLKKRVPSLLAGSGLKTAAAHGHASAHAGEDAPIAADCVSAGADAICVHQSHTLPLLLDAVHWTMELCMDDGAGARWPLQLDSHAFRRLLQEAGAMEVLRDSWLALLQSGEIFFPATATPTPGESIVLNVLAQLRRHTFQQIIAQFAMDEARQVQSLPEFMSVWPSSPDTFA